MVPPKKPFDDRLDELEAALPHEEHWERPTQAQIRRITARTPGTDPPVSSVGKHWSPAGVVLVITAFGGLMTTIGVVVAPLLTKPDLTGYVKEERLTACETRLEARTEAHEKAREDERGRTARCYDKLGACQSQQGADKAVIESMEAKKRRLR